MSRRKVSRKPSRGPEASGSPLESAALALAGAILLAAPFLIPSLSWLHWVALVPWTLLVIRPEAHRPYLWFLLGTVAFFLMAFGPFSALNKVIPFAMAPVFGPMLFPFAPVVRLGYRRFRPPLALLVPVAWVAAEWLRLRFSVGELALFPLGSSQFGQTRLIQIAELTGLAGISFLLAAAGGAAAELWRGRGRRAWISLGIAGLLLAAALAYGHLRLGSLGPFRPGPRIALVQPNEVHYRDPSRTRELFDRQVDFARDEIPPGTADLVALPENTIDYPFSEDPYFAAGLARLARDRRAAVVAGAFSWGSPDKKTLRTSAYYYAASGEPVGDYHKIYLIPWAEYLPFEDWLPRLSPALARGHADLRRRVLGYSAPGVPGDEVTLFPIETESESFRFAIPICYEVGHRAFAPRAVAAGADFLLNISSEGFFGAPVYFHMWALSTLRAVENRIAVVRVGNNGISGFIDPAGRPGKIVRGNETGRPYLEPGTTVDRVRVGPTGSFYSRHGDLFAYLCLASSALLLAGGLASRRRSRAASARGTSRRP